MANLLNENEIAAAWAQETIAAAKEKNMFGSITSGVIWAELKDPTEGRHITIDPEKLAASINERGYPLLLGHDPGKPIGRLIAARVFKSADGRKFVGAVFGHYEGSSAQQGFSDFGFDPSSTFPPPSQLPTLDQTHWIEIAVDPREVDATWTSNAASGAPLRVKRKELSHNAAEAAIEIVRITVPLIALIWNPYVTAIASEAGKDTYKAFRKWLDRFFEKISERENPLAIFQCSTTDCDLFFIVRGNNLDNLLAARDRLETAATQAANLGKLLARNNLSPRSLYYEFDNARKIWLPLYAELSDGRLITDNRALVVAEKLPQGLSLGLTTNSEE